VALTASDDGTHTSAPELFKGRHFDQEIIVLCVRWYLTFKLSSRDLVQMMAERGITLTHTTIFGGETANVPRQFIIRSARFFPGAGVPAVICPFLALDRDARAPLI
jgi:hypothetical protein